MINCMFLGLAMLCAPLAAQDVAHHAIKSPLDLLGLHIEFAATDDDASEIDVSKNGKRLFQFFGAAGFNDQATAEMISAESIDLGIKDAHFLKLYLSAGGNEGDGQAFVLQVKGPNVTVVYNSGDYGAKGIIEVESSETGLGGIIRDYLDAQFAREALGGFSFVRFSVVVPFAYDPAKQVFVPSGRGKPGIFDGVGRSEWDPDQLRQRAILIEVAKLIYAGKTDEGLVYFDEHWPWDNRVSARKEIEDTIRHDPYIRALLAAKPAAGPQVRK